MCDCLTNEHLCDVDTNPLRLRDFVGLAALLALAAAACGSEEVAVPASVAQADATTTTFAAVEEVSSTAGAVEVAEVGTEVVEGEVPATAEVVEVVVEEASSTAGAVEVAEAGTEVVEEEAPATAEVVEVVVEEASPTTTTEAMGDAAADTGPLRLAADVLAELRVAPEQRSGYDRDHFSHWSDLDGDGCDTRREVLIRDSRVQSTLDPNRTCWVVSGLWYSHYDGEWVEGPSSLDIDHLVPLAEAWDSGAHSWEPGRREEFANDEGALLAVTARSNRAKGASDPAGWMPSNEDFTCPYAAAWIAVKARWNLTMDHEESDFLQRLLAGRCSGSTLHIRTPVLAFPILDTPTLDTPTLDTPTLDTPGGRTEVPPDPGDSKNCSDFSTQGQAQEWFDIYFPHYGDVARLDRDGDGAVCESLPAG